MKIGIIGFLCDFVIGMLIFAAFNYFKGETPIFDIKDLVKVLILVTALTWSQWFWRSKVK